MNLKKIKIIIIREFLVRVRKKSFIIVTLLTPILMAALMAVPTLMMTIKDNEQHKIMVIDPGGTAREILQDTEDVSFVFSVNGRLEDFKRDFKQDGLYAVCVVNQEEGKDLTVSMYSYKQINMDITSMIERAFEKEIENRKLQNYGIPDIDRILSEVKTDVSVKTLVWDEKGEEKESFVGVYMGIAYITSFLIYIFIFMYGAMIIRGVIEEKTNRIVEVIISSVKPIELMVGKIIGVALVAILQFALWILLFVVIFFTLGTIFGLHNLAPDSMAAGGEMANGIQALAQNNTVNVIMETLKGLHIGRILACFFIFFVLGYLLYASMFAAIGSISDTETETQQFQMPVTLPLILGLFIMMHTFQYPDSQLSFWGSIIPFTSPMVMLARVPFGVPLWQLLLSIALLLGTFIAIAYFSAKIYRVGILMYGKKVTWKELWKWMRYKN